MLTRNLVVSQLAILLLSLPLHAQEAHVVVQAVKAEEGALGAEAVVAGEGVLIGSAGGEGVVTYSFSAADSSGAWNVMPPMRLGSYVPNDSMGMLRLPQFEKELELVDEQKEKIRQLRDEIGEAQREVHAKMRHKPGEPQPDWRELQKERREVQRRIRGMANKRLEDILLPHQSRRLEELRVQLKLRNQGAYALTGNDFVEALELTDEQKKQLVEKQREVQKKLQEKMQQLRDEFRQEVFNDVLTKSQLDKLRRLTGEKYEVKTPDYKSSFYRTRRATNGEKK